MSSRENHQPSDFQDVYSNHPQHLQHQPLEFHPQEQDQDQDLDAEGSVDNSLLATPRFDNQGQDPSTFQDLLQSGSASNNDDEEEEESSADSDSQSDSEDHQVIQNQEDQPRNSALKRIKLKLPSGGGSSSTSQSFQDQHNNPTTMTRRTSSRNQVSINGSPDFDSVRTNGNGNGNGSSGRMTRNSSRKVASFEEQNDDQEEELNDTQQSEDPLLLQGDDDDQDAKGEDDDEDEDEQVRPVRQTRSGRAAAKSYVEPEDDDDVLPRGKRSSTRASSRAKSRDLNDFVEDDDEDDPEANFGSSRNRKSRITRGGHNKLAALQKRKQSKRREEDYHGIDDGDETPDEDIDLEGSEFEDLDSGKRKLRERKRVNYALIPAPGEPERDRFGKIKRGKTVQDWDLGLGGSNDEGMGGGRKKPFSLPYSGGSNRAGKDGWNSLPMSMTGRDYAAAFGEVAGDDSSDDDIPRARRNGVSTGTSGAPSGGGGGGGALLGGAGNVAGAGGGSADALGRIKTGGDPLADVDPLGVDARVTFDSVGGLDGHISQLKEMVALPLLYPELFQRFGVTPPRGVLFHGPPGTGKTLVARALASSCSPPKQDSSEGGTGGTAANGTASSTSTTTPSHSNQPETSANGAAAAAASEAAKATLAAPSGGTSSTGEISFFMRKGADCLSKWVGEAERQLRLLFDEARACQPSIIFFDEIDGLAPVRSAKQDQIHASIVSTLLALMDGLDPRGQVVVIGATNRPDAIDPALRRPGRFDREFYFPLPDMEARRKIIQINTKKWDPPLEDSFLDRLAEVTKGYGGADIRALCTEAALSAIQRRYPQIYSTNERLLLNPESINVDAKDFMMSVSKLVPSSARSTSSPASPLPEHFKPLLGETVAKAIAALNRVLPASAKRNALEEALWEDEPSHASASTSTLPEDGGFGREMLLQSFESLRVFRPRLLIHGKPGMGQTFVGSALLQHLEGYHVQALDLGSLLGDSARTAEAAVVQLFQEAKRHRPSIIFIPGLAHWAHALSESTKATVKALLDGLSPSDPVLLLAVSETPASKLPADVRSWFGYVRENRVDVPSPTESQRRSFFTDLMEHAARPPVDFPDALPRRKKVLEKLPLAPARAPRAPTSIELQAQEEADGRTLEHLKYRLGPVLGELRKKYRRFTRDVWEEYNLIELTKQFDFRKEKGKVIVTIRYDRPVSAVRRRHSSLDRIERPAAEPVAPSSSGELRPVVEIEEPSSSGDITMQDGEGSSQHQMQMQMQEHQDNDVEANGVSTPIAQIGGLPGEEQAPPSSAPPKLNGQHAAPLPQAQDQSVIDLTKTADNDDDDYELRDLVIHTMTLDKMQKRLYHNGYLTVAAFNGDLAKILENAEAAQEVDADRLFRARQMQNLASIMIDQYVDTAFRVECERMASRQEAREAKVKEVEDQAKAKANASASATLNNGAPRQSARVQGKDPEFKQPTNIGALERKRSRRGSSEPKDSETNKRTRVEGPHNPSPLGLNAPILPGRAGSPSPSQNQQVGNVAPQTTGPAPGNQQGDSQSQDQVVAQVDDMQVDNLLNPSTLTNVNGHHSNQQPPSQLDSVAPEIAVRSGTETPAKESTPPPPPPPFVIDQSQLAKLQSHILEKTASFNTEQLEQLRATCFAAVWRRRSEYNRKALLEEMWEITDDISCAVEDERRELEEMEGENGY